MMNEYLAWLLIVIGVLLMIAELFMPTAGVCFALGAGGAIVGVTSLLVLNTIMGLLAASGLILAVPLLIPLRGFAARTPLGKKFFLPSADEINATPDYPVHATLEGLKGRYGQTTSVLRPAGTTNFSGRNVDTLSDGPMIEKGRWVRCIDVQGGKVIVREATPPNLEKGF